MISTGAELQSKKIELCQIRLWYSLSNTSVILSEMIGPFHQWHFTIQIISSINLLYHQLEKARNDVYYKEIY